MSRPRRPLKAWICVVGLALLAAVAGVRGQEIVPVVAEVQSVRFQQVRAPRQSRPWAQMEVVLQVRSNPDNASHPRWVDRLKTEVYLGWDVSTGGVRRREYYRASATAVTVSLGRAVYRFFLPPEVMERDNIDALPDYWLVVLSYGDRELPIVSANTSRSLTSLESAARFRETAIADGSENDGVLVPVHESPFTLDTNSDEPTLIRPRRP